MAKSRSPWNCYVVNVCPSGERPIFHTTMDFDTFTIQAWDPCAVGSPMLSKPDGGTLREKTRRKSISLHFFGEAFVETPNPEHPRTLLFRYPTDDVIQGAPMICVFVFAFTIFAHCLAWLKGTINFWLCCCCRIRNNNKTSENNHRQRPIIPCMTQEEVDKNSQPFALMGILFTSQSYPNCKEALYPRGIRPYQGTMMLVTAFYYTLILSGVVVIGFLELLCSVYELI